MGRGGQEKKKSVDSFPESIDLEKLLDVSGPYNGRDVYAASLVLRLLLLLFLPLLLLLLLSCFSSSSSSSSHSSDRYMRTKLMNILFTQGLSFFPFSDVSLALSLSPAYASHALMFPLPLTLCFHPLLSPHPSIELARRLAGSGAIAVSLHPGVGAQFRALLGNSYVSLAILAASTELSREFKYSRLSLLSLLFLSLSLSLSLCVYVSYLSMPLSGLTLGSLSTQS